jgi:chromosome segregation ATPase
LGDLAAIEKKYDAAVSNGAGALDNILVDTTTNAQHCVEYLRRCGHTPASLYACSLLPLGNSSMDNGTSY